MEITRFIKGFISELDLESTIAPEGSLRDCINVEINSPLGAITNCMKYNAVFGSDFLPGYGGSEAIAIKKFSVDSPSAKEISALIMRSTNQLLYSEDFEITPWAVNNLSVSANAGDGPTRRHDTVTASVVNGYVEQTFSLPVGTEVIFSLYFKGGSDVEEWKISIIDGAGQDDYDFVPTGSGVWQRISVVRTLGSGTGQKVRLWCSVYDASGALDVWGAQLEIGAAASVYGCTCDINLPYYVYIRPYYNGTAWVDGWRCLNEKRSFLVDSVTVPNVLYPQGTAIATASEGDDYFRRWMIYSPGSAATNYNANQRILSFDQSADEFLTEVQYDRIHDDIAIVCRSPIPIDNANGTTLSDKYSSQYDSVILPHLYENNGVVTCIFPSDTITRNACVIKYILRPNVLSTDVDFNEFYLDKESMSYNSTWFRPPFTISVTAQAAGGSIADGEYYVAAVALMDDGSRILCSFDSDTIAGGGGSGSLSIQVNCYLTFMSPRVISVELYTGSGSAVDSITAYYDRTILVNDTPTWTKLPAGGYYYITRTLTQVYSTNPSMFVNMQRSPTVETTADYKYKSYVNGRYFVAGMRGKEDSVRFTHISDVVSELSIYPYDAASSYGEIIAISGTAEKIIGLAKTITNDLMIFKDKTVLIYEIQSGRTGLKRLFTAFQGIGCVTHKSIVETDFGVLWYDTNNVYQYAGGSFDVKRIGTGRVAKYIKSISSYLPYSFATFVRGINEYWIFTQKSGSVGSATLTDYVVLRYAVEFDNWNILQWSYVPKDVTQTIDGTIEVLSNGQYLKFWSGGSSMLTTDGFVETHRIPVGGFDDKLITQIGTEHNISTINCILKLLLNEESGVRPGNSVQIPYAFKSMLKQPRTASSCRTFRLRFEGEPTSFVIKMFKVELSLMKKRYKVGRA